MDQLTVAARHDQPAPDGSHVNHRSSSYARRVHVAELTTPALVVDVGRLDANLATMAEALPGRRLRPHVKAHKCTSLAARQAALGHTGFTCATIAEMEGMARAGLGEDLLLANEVADATRLGALARTGARVTVAVDSVATIEAVADAGVREVLVDVNVGLPRCGCAPEDAGRLADHARRRGLEVRGVMGYEGHVVGLADRAARTELLAAAMALLLAAHDLVGGEVVSAGGTGTYDTNRWATEIQAGSYALMDTAYATLGLPFAQALHVVATVVSVSPGWAVADCGLKALGMDHGNPSVEGGTVRFCSDEHVTFVPDAPVAVGDRVRVVPAHVDPTVAYHAQLHVVDGDEVTAHWPVDLRGW
jgi:D-serine deaminase-like pyridoxal phosphate-dependent protein